MNNPQTIKQALPLDWLLASNEKITEEKLQAAQDAQRYEHREKIPETYLWMSDLYHELTGQEPNKRVMLDWLQTFEEWKQERLEADHLRTAWAQANDINKGFPVGRPGALTTTAVSVKSKAKATVIGIQSKRVEETLKLIDEKWQGNFVPRPANVERPKNLAPRRTTR
jgi:hypothetical protein